MWHMIWNVLESLRRMYPDLRHLVALNKKQPCFYPCLNPYSYRLYLAQERNKSYNTKKLSINKPAPLHFSVPSFPFSLFNISFFLIPSHQHPSTTAVMCNSQKYNAQAKHSPSETSKLSKTLILNEVNEGDVRETFKYCITH